MIPPHEYDQMTHPATKPRLMIANNRSRSCIENHCSETLQLVAIFQLDVPSAILTGMLFGDTWGQKMAKLDMSLVLKRENFQTGYWDQLLIVL